MQIISSLTSTVKEQLSRVLTRTLPVASDEEKGPEKFLKDWTSLTESLHEAKERIQKHPFVNKIVKSDTAKAGDGIFTVDFEFEKENANPSGTCHGGAIAAICDAAGVEAARATIPYLNGETNDSKVGNPLTRTLNTKFFRPVSEGDTYRVIATAAHKSKPGQGMGGATAYVLNPNGDVVASSQIDVSFPKAA